MKRITILLIGIGCSLALAGAVFAQQPQPEQSPKKEKRAPTEKAGAAERKGKPATAAEAQSPAPGGKQPGAEKRGRERGAVKGEKTGAGATGAETSPSAGATASAAPTGKGAERGGKSRRAREEAEKARASATPATGTAATATPAAATPATGATGARGAAGKTAGATQGTVGRGGKKVEPQQVQQIKQQHANFRAQPRPDKAPTVTFNQNFRIVGAESWQGPQYEVFRSYHPEWHDQGWYRSRYTRVELIGGGWYFWNAGYWYPAWGYDPGVAYYPYDGPIYVGQRAEPPDRVIADVQAELQEMGYYQGEVDGLLGPLTRQALADYQSDHGLAVTQAIDEPTLDALQLS